MLDRWRCRSNFNNILTAVMANAEVAQRYMAPDHPAFEPLSEVTLATARAELLSKQWLFFRTPGK